MLTNTVEKPAEELHLYNILVSWVSTWVFPLLYAENSFIPTSKQTDTATDCSASTEAGQPLQSSKQLSSRELASSLFVI